MRMLTWTILAALAAVLPAGQAMADMDAKPGSPTAGDWLKRTPVTPNPDKVIVPSGYKVGVFKAGLDTPSAAAVDILVISRTADLRASAPLTWWTS